MTPDGARLIPTLYKRGSKAGLATAEWCAPNSKPKTNGRSCGSARLRFCP